MESLTHFSLPTTLQTTGFGSYRLRRSALWPALPMTLSSTALEFPLSTAFSSVAIKKALRDCGRVTPLPAQISLCYFVDMPCPGSASAASVCLRRSSEKRATTPGTSDWCSRVKTWPRPYKRCGQLFLSPHDALLLPTLFCPRWAASPFSIPTAVYLFLPCCDLQLSMLQYGVKVKPPPYFAEAPSKQDSKAGNK
jgi:hypothetical protein